MKFRDFIDSADTANTANTVEATKPQGTYVAARCSAETNKQLQAFAREQGLKPQDEYHCTLIYSTVSFEFPALQEFDVTTGLKEYAKFGEKEECLVVLLDAPEMKHLHAKIMEENPKATYSFEQYIPHVTLSDNHKGDIPPILPPFNFTFDKLYSESLKD